MGTPARMLATYVVFQNHLPMVADYPSSYRGHPALPILAAIPSTWDDTRCLPSSVGEHVTIARRHGDDWWIGSLAGRNARDLVVPLTFLGPGRYRSETFADELGGASLHRLSQRTAEVTAGVSLTIRLAPAGGQLTRLTPLPGG